VLKQRLSDAVYRCLLADQHDQRRPAAAPGSGGRQMAGEQPTSDREAARRSRVVSCLPSQVLGSLRRMDSCGTPDIDELRSLSLLVGLA